MSGRLSASGGRGADLRRRLPWPHRYLPRRRAHRRRRAQVPQPPIGRYVQDGGRAREDGLWPGERQSAWCAWTSQFS